MQTPTATTTPLPPGKFVTFEGIDGAGKSSHIPFVAEFLRSRGLEVVVTREPGGTPLGERLREILLHEPMHRDTEALLMFAARREHLAQVIEPALKRGAWVLSDRFSDATFAYQCGGRGMAEVKCRLMEYWVHDGLTPDLTFLFDLPEAMAQARINTERVLDKFEREKANFHQNVRSAYLQRAKEAPHRFQVIDAGRSLEEVREVLKPILQYFVEAKGLDKHLRDPQQPDDAPNIRAARLLRDLVASIELHTDCMSGQIAASALYDQVDLAEAELKALGFSTGTA